MDERYWIRLLPWRKKNRAETKAAQIKFAAQLRIIREDGWAYLQLRLENRSSWTVWVKEATVTLIDLDAKEQTTVPIGRATHEILQNVFSNESLCVSLAREIYDAAGRPQGPYSCFVVTNVLYCVFDEWCNIRLETYRVEMAALTAVGLHSSRWYDKKIKQARRRSILPRNNARGGQNCLEGGSCMLAEGEVLVCTNHECGAEYVVRRKPALQEQNSRCTCGNELKKVYHAPRFRIDSGAIPA